MNKNLFFGISEIACKISDGFSRPFRPIIRFLTYIATLVATILIIPFIPILRLVNRRGDGVYWKIREDLEKIWYRQSTHEALLALRKIYTEFRELPGKDQKTEIRQYGKIGFFQRYRLILLLYHWELYHGNWDEAYRICEDELSLILHSDQKPGLVEIEWIICKAHCIYNLHGKTKAREYLFPYLDPNNSGSPVNQYFDKLKRM